MPDRLTMLDCGSTPPGPPDPPSPPLSGSVRFISRWKRGFMDACTRSPTMNKVNGVARVTTFS